MVKYTHGKSPCAKDRPSGRCKKIFLQSVKSAPHHGQTVVALQGDLGAGKTTLTKHIAHILGIRGRITSPTFVVEKIYGLPKRKDTRFQRFIHIDAYRLEHSGELDALGWHTLVNDPR
jgi:tRNA threonylcarbamoyladenosine biosynthesis protein TsaE